MKYPIKKAVSFMTMAAIVVGITCVPKTEALTTTTYYVKYDYETNTVHPDYDISVSDNSTASVQSRGIVGGENRQRDGHDGIVRLVSPSGWRGTGFIVGDHTIATAAHCVYKEDERYAATNYFVTGLQVQTYNADGTQSSTAPFDVKEVHLEADYLDYDFERENDYALLTVEEDLSEYTHFDLGIPYDVYSDEFVSNDLYVTGIPQALNNGETSNGNYNVYTGKGYSATVNEQLREEGVFYFTCDTSGGNSGSPVYLATKYTIRNPVDNTIMEEHIVYTAISILSGPGYQLTSNPDTYLYNEGTLFDSTKVKFYTNNPNIGY